MVEDYYVRFPRPLLTFCINECSIVKFSRFALLTSFVPPYENVILFEICLYGLVFERTTGMRIYTFTVWYEFIVKSPELRDHYIFYSI